MTCLRFFGCYLILCFLAHPATIGTVVNITGGASDIILDEPRGRLYLVRPSPYNLVDIYSIPQRRVLASVATDRLPLAAAMSPDRKFLYVTCHDSSALTVIDIERATPAKVGTVSLPAKPEGVAVGNDGRVLITTIGAGQGNLLNTLLLYDPSISDIGRTLSTVPVAPPPPLPPQLPPLAGRVFLSNRSQLIATPDGSRIVGVNAFNQNNRVVFVYEAASGTVKASRFVGDVSTVLSLSSDGSKFMLGLRLFETESLTVLAQQNAANAMFPLSATITAQGFAQVGQQFNLQQNQGGSAFAPDGSRIFTAFNIAPVQSPAARPNITQLMVNDPDNLLIEAAFQLTENLAGKMVIASDGSTIYGLSESGLLIIELARVLSTPLIQPEATVLLLGSDQCNVNPYGRTGKVAVQNMGGGELRPGQTQLVLLQAMTGTTIPGLGGAQGPGGGVIGGGGITIILPPVPGAGLPGQLPAGMNAQQAQSFQTAPRSAINREDGSFEFTFNPLAGRSPGTIPPHDFLLQSQAAANVPARIRVFQNSRNSEARGDIYTVPVNLSPNEGLIDIVPDYVRQYLYIANSGMNRVEVFDIRRKQFLSPIKVGQLPRSLALAPDGNTLYVACSGGEVISIIDLVQMQNVGRVKFPPIPFNGNVPVITPSVIAASQHGLQIVMSNGTLWRVVGNEAVPRAISPIIGSNTVTAPRSLINTPNGEFILLLDGSGNAFLYDSLVDDFVQRRQVVTAPIQGYYGPVGAGPRGQYYLVNGFALNSSLSPLSTAGLTTVPGPTRPGQAPAQVARPISAVAAGTATTFIRFAQPVLANANALSTEAPTLELVDVNSGQVLRQSQALEGPLAAVAGTQRSNVPGRQIAVDSSGTTAFALTTSGLSVIPLDPVTVQDRPVLSPNGVVNTASYQPGAAPGSMVSMFGRNFSSSTEAASNVPLPTVLGGTCVTLNNVPLPLTLVSPTQINAQIPPELAAGRYPLVIRSVDRKAAGNPQQLTVSRYAPAVFTDPATGQALIFHADGNPVTPQNPARRDRPLVMYATGLGVPRGARISSGNPAPADPLVASDNVVVHFGDPRYAQSEVIVDWSGFAPGFIGVYQINLRVPGWNMGSKADHPVTLKIGGLCSPTRPDQTPADCPKVTTDPPVVPTVAMN